MEDSAPPHRFLLGGGPSPRLVGGIQEGSRRGLGRNVPALSLAFIHPSSWNRNSRKLNFAFTEFSEVATVFRGPLCGERDIPDTRRRTVPPPIRSPSGVLPCVSC